MKIFGIAIVLALLAVGGLALIERPGSALAGRVTYVIDGDTVVVRLESDEAVHVRLIGINTPEIAHFGKPGECFGIRAARLTRRLALGHRVLLQAGRERHDRYGRLLAYVRVLGGAHARHRTQRGPRRGLCRPRGQRAPCRPRTLGSVRPRLIYNLNVSEEIAALRTIVAQLPPAPEAMAPYLAKVRECAYAVTDAEVELLKKDFSEDEIFEQTVAVAIAQGLRRYDAALGAIG